MNNGGELIGEYERILQDLIEMPPARFDQHLDAALLRAHGLYAISMMGAPEGEYLHVGKTASGLPGLCAKMPNERAEIAHQLRSERRVMAVRVEGRPGAPPLLVFAAPISVIDPIRLGGFCHVCSLQSSELSEADVFYVALQRYLSHFARERDFPACGVPMTHGEFSKAVQLHVDSRVPTI